MTIKIRSNKVLLENELREATISVKEGCIADISDDRGTDVIDYGDAIIAPGFIDIHTHGGYGCEIMEADRLKIYQWLSQLPKEGTTSLLISPYSSSVLSMQKAIDAICTLEEKRCCADVLGVYLEGPFISKRQLGAMNEKSVLAPDISKWQEIVGQHERAIKLCALACEADFDFALMDTLVSKQVKIAGGHTDMTYAQACNAAAHGMIDFTHCGNAMRGIHHREVGTLGAAMLLDDCYCEVIADGKHVSFELLRLLYKTKPKDKLILITDSLSAKGLAEGDYQMDGILVTVKNKAAYIHGTNQLAGSTLSMAQAVANAVQYGGFTVVDALHAASLNPATLIGVHNKKGQIRVGFNADLCVLDSAFQIQQTYYKGKAMIS